MDLKQIKEELVGAGIEVYRTRAAEIQIAERVRLHIMDSGIRVRLGERLEIVFTARSQRSDWAGEPSAEEMLAHVRKSVGPTATARGYVEAWSGTTPVTDPLDEQRVLDVWHEVTYAKPADDPHSAIDEVRWALGIDRFVPPDGVGPDGAS